MTGLQDAIDYTVLGWLKPELDEELRRVRADIEAFIDNRDDFTPVRESAAALHRVQGSLRMLELTAPVLVAEEMERVVRAIEAGDVQGEKVDEACSTLMHGTVVLPDYLERLQGGYREIPIVLLPLLNELRAARGDDSAADIGALVGGHGIAEGDASPEELEHARASTSGRNRALLDTVAGAIKDDLLRVKDKLDLFLRGNRSDLQLLDAEVGTLGNIGDTLAMLGLDNARAIVQKQRDAVQQIVMGERQADEDTLLDIASSLLFVDASLDDQVANIGSASLGGATEASEEAVLASESRRVVGVVAREAISNFADARQAFVGFVETGWDHAQMTEVPRLLREAGGAMRMLGHSEPADYLLGVAYYTQRRVIDTRRIPDSRELDTFADALASLEYYMEALRDGRGSRTEILSITHKSLEQLGVWPLPDDVHDVAPVVEVQTPASMREVRLSPTPGIDAAAPPEVPVAVMPAHGEAVSPMAAIDALPVTDAAPVVSAAPAPAAAAPAPSGGDGDAIELVGFELSGNDIDDDIREIFLEEFAEEMGHLDELMPKWKADPENIDTALSIRRIFHTLKGSGRLVGAKMLGEFSWKVENMLNRVRDGARPVTPAVVALVEEAQAVLPRLHEALAGQTGVHARLPAIEAVAERIADGEEAFLAAAPAAMAAPIDAAAVAERAPTMAVSSVDAAASEPDVLATVDPVLLEILEAEVGSHLSTVDAWVANADAEPIGSEALMRAVHTMNGAFAMTDVPVVVDVIAPAEAYIKRMVASAQPATADGIAAIGALSSLLADNITRLKSDRPHVRGDKALLERFAALRDSLPDAPSPLLGPLKPYDLNLQDAGDADVPVAVEMGTFVEASDDQLQAQAEQERLAAEHAERERLAAEHAEQARLAAERAEQERVAGERAEMERLAAEQAERERLEAERLEAVRVAREREDAERAEQERLATERAEMERLAAEHAEAERLQAERERERLAAEQAEHARLATERAEAERLEALRLQIERLDDEPVVAANTEVDAWLQQEAEQLEQARREAEGAFDPQATPIIDESDADTLAAAVAPLPASAEEIASWTVVDDRSDEEKRNAELAVAALREKEFRDFYDMEEARLIEARLRAEAEDLQRQAIDFADASEDEQAREVARISALREKEFNDLLRAEEARLITARLQAEAQAARNALQQATEDDASASAIAPDPSIDEFRRLSDEYAATATFVEDEEEDALGAIGGGEVAFDDDSLAALAAAPAASAAVATGGEAMADWLRAVLRNDTAGEVQPLRQDDLDMELVDMFVEETRDLLDDSDRQLQQLRDPDPDVAVTAIVPLQRNLHTIKGGARMAGLMAIGDLGHAMESLLESVSEGRVQLGRDDAMLLERGFDRLHHMVSRIEEREDSSVPAVLVDAFDARSRGELPSVSDAQPLFDLGDAAAPEPVHFQDLSAIDEAPVTTPALQDIAPSSTLPANDAIATPASPRVAAALSAPMADTVDDDGDMPRPVQDQVRIRADLLDRLVNHAGEVAIYRSRLEQQLGAFRGAMNEMEQTNLRLRDQLRRLELETEAQIIARYQREHDTADANFDPLELDRFSTLQQLTRALSESATDLTSLQSTLEDLTRQYETLLTQQSRVSSELQDGLMRTRMVPFETIVPRLRRLVRQAAADTHKQAALQLVGTGAELDRNVLERMVAPMEHLLRNAIAHGIELPEARRAAGKDESGTLRIKLGTEGSEVVIHVTDDGAGLNRAAIRKRAEERGLIAVGEQLSDAALDQLILRPGFSTVDTVNLLAGRGVGMDVVANEVQQLGGTLDIASTPGEGAQFILRLPQKLAVTQAVFVRIGETTYAVPVSSVQGVGRIARDRLAEGVTQYEYGGQDYAIHDLGRLLGTAPAKAEGQLQLPMVLVRAGELRAAVGVDDVIGSREIVVKPVGPQIGSIPGVFGATVMGDGGVVIILDLPPLVRRAEAMPHDYVPTVHAEPEKHVVPLVMVVDDSVTMRKVSGRVLERQGFEVMTAKDGLDALEQLADRVPDLMLLDIEMPRMDGYELATAMKADTRLNAIPIIMITSRTGDKHRDRAYSLGVNRYLGKPYQEPELLRNVYELLGIERPQASEEGMHG